MSRWAALAICAAVVVAVGIFGTWAFAVRDSGETVFVTARGSGNSAEDAWASDICTAVAVWEREWKTTVVQPTSPTDPRTRVPIARVIERMQRLTNRLRTDIARVVPPTDRTRKWQRYLAKTVREHAEKFARLEPDNLVVAGYAGPPPRSRAGVLREHAVDAWFAVSNVVRWDANLASPHLGVLFAESNACDEADRYSATGTDWP